MDCKSITPGSNPGVTLDYGLWVSGGIGRRVGFKIQWPFMAVRVQVPPYLKRGQSVKLCLFFYHPFIEGELECLVKLQMLVYLVELANLNAQ